jgi:hypothetical protein
LLQAITWIPLRQDTNKRNTYGVVTNAVRNTMAAHKTCIGCKHISSNKCGTIVKVRGSSGAVSYKKEPDRRCIRRKEK